AVTVCPGDVNSDGQRTVTDVIRILNHIVGNIVLTGAELSAADVNGNGSVAVNDAIQLQNHIVGNTSLPTCDPNLGTATLQWDAPTTNVDGSPLTDLGGFKLHYGTASGNYGASVDVGNQTSFTVRDLQPGNTYFFVVSAYDISGDQSGFSNEV